MPPVGLPPFVWEQQPLLPRRLHSHEQFEGAVSVPGRESALSLHSLFGLLGMGQREEFLDPLLEVA